MVADASNRGITFSINSFLQELALNARRPNKKHFLHAVGGQLHSCTSTRTIPTTDLPGSPKSNPNPNLDALGGSRSAGAVARTALQCVFRWRFFPNKPGPSKGQPAIDQTRRTTSRVFCFCRADLLRYTGLLQKWRIHLPKE